jgi:dolichyl-phosphate-mannose--protein O-mannosyl transferase
LAIAVGLQPWVQLKLVVLALSATAVAFSFLWIRARRRAVLALATGLIIAVAPGVLQEGRWILSDVPFWAFTMIALWAFERLRPDDWKRFAVAAVAVLLAYFTRSAG